MQVAFLIDGFNLYHSIRDVISDRHGGANLKWLDIRGLCSAILRDPAQLPRTAWVSDIQYFTALAKHMEARSPRIVQRHRAFIDAQQALGVTVHLGAFKRTAKGFEEKETDVAIGVALLEIFHNSDADCVFIMSGDTDIMPALRAARRMYSGCRIGFAFPYKRQNNSLRDAADMHVRIRAHRYAKHILPNPVVATDGREIHCPSEWRSV